MERIHIVEFLLTILSSLLIIVIMVGKKQNILIMLVADLMLYGVSIFKAIEEIAVNKSIIGSIISVLCDTFLVIRILKSTKELCNRLFGKTVYTERILRISIARKEEDDDDEDK